MGVGLRHARGQLRRKESFMLTRITNIKLSPDEALRPLEEAAARALKVNKKEILSVRLIKKSVDARNKSDIRLLVTLDAETKNRPAYLPAGASEAKKSEPWTVKEDAVKPAHPPVVVGMGPCGLFAALTLARRGLRPVVLERGKKVEERTRDVNRFFDTGSFLPSSNVQFGEGGAGAFSDGKLNTGIKDDRLRRVLETFVEFGAPEEILYEAKPHVGTDKLSKVVAGMRNEIIRLGGDVRFETALTSIVVEGGRVTAAVTDKGIIETCGIILAPGHSARDTFTMLNEKGVSMERKPFSIGARIEHSQKWLDRAQYGAFATHPALGRADYKLNVRAPSGRGVYTFCMCPGGYVIAAAGESEGVVTNGMSTFARDGENCNSALLVDVHTDDFPESEGVLAGMYFQRDWEHRAWLLGGSTYRAPAQLSGDFLKNVASSGAGGIAPSYRPGVTWTNLTECLPGFASRDMRFAIEELGKRVRGFDAPDAVLTGVETRSSSPVRVLRSMETYESAVRGLYPAGEGAGYAGGISSAAVDGMRVAEAFNTGV